MTGARAEPAPQSPVPRSPVPPEAVPRSPGAGWLARLWVTFRLDMLVQARNQLYPLGLGVSLAMTLLLLYLLGGEALRPVLPAALVLHLGSTACFFAAALVLFEKSEGTLAAQRVTPLRTREYLGSKVITLGGFATLEGLILVVFSQGADVAWGWYLAGALSLGTIYTLMGLALAAPHTSITEFMVPNGIVLGTLVGLPVLPSLGIFEGPWWLLVPLTPQVALFEAAFAPIEPWRLVYAAVGTVVELAALGWWTHRRFERFVAGALR